MPGRRARLAASVIASASMLVAACSDPSGDPGARTDSSSATTITTTPSSTAAAAVTPTGRPYAVRKMVVTLVDTSRPTDDPIDLLDSPHRSLVTDVHLPDSDEPGPLIVLAHGRNGDPGKLANLATTWATAGYIVAAPLFPLTYDVAPSASRIADYTNQPGDVSFVIDELLRRSDLADGPLAGRVDSEHIAVAGLSLGAATAYAVAFNSCCRDDRVGAALLMAGYRFPFDGEYDLRGVPTLWVHGDADASLPYSDSVEAYSLAGAPKILVTLVDGSHSDPFENDIDPHDDVVAAITVDFWDAYLGGDERAVERLLADADAPGLATVEAEI